MFYKNINFIMNMNIEQETITTMLYNCKSLIIKAIIAVTLVVTDFMTNVPKWFYWSLN